MPGNAGDDLERPPPCPNADGLRTEAVASHSEGSTGDIANDCLGDIQADLAETRPSSNRTSNQVNLDPNNAGGVGSRDTGDEHAESADQPSNQDRWLIEVDCIVRQHNLSRTTFFSPPDCPDDLQPTDVTRIAVLRTTKQKFDCTPVSYTTLSHQTITSQQNS